MREIRMSGSMSGDWKRVPINGLPRQSSTLHGSPGWNRTNDQRINSPMLYR